MKQCMLLLLISFVLVGCSNETYTRIDVHIPFLATVNLKDTSVTFLSKQYEVLGTWDLDLPFTGSLLLKDQDTILFYGKDMDTIEVYSLSKGQRIATWKADKGIVNMKQIRDGDSIVAVNQSLNTISFYNDAGKIENQSKVGKAPLTILQGDHKLYVVNFGDTKLSVIDVRTRKVEQEFPIHVSSTGALLREDKKEIWLGGHGQGSKVEDYVYIYSTETGTLKRKLKAPSMPVNIVEDPAGIFILSHGTNSLYKYKGNNIVESTTVGVNPFEMIHFQDDLIVASYDSDELYIINPKDASISQQIKVGKGPFQMISRE